MKWKMNYISIDTPVKSTCLLIIGNKMLRIKNFERLGIKKFSDKRRQSVIGEN